MKYKIRERCKLCEGKMQFIFKANGCKLSKCEKCNFVQVVHADKIPVYKYEMNYFTSSKYKDDSALQKEHARRKKMLMKYCNKESWILDYGCASGEFVHFVSDVYKAEGCDISADAIAIAREKYTDIHDRFWCVVKQDHIAREYDAVCLWDVIEHVADPYESLSNLKKIIKDDGYLFISTPNIGAVFARMLKSKWPFMTPPEHLSFFSYKSIRRLAGILGMEIVEWSSKGKWANVGFILYKFNRVSDIKIPDKIINIFQTTFLSKWNIYVPTGDIQYVVLKKNGK